MSGHAGVAARRGQVGSGGGPGVQRGNRGQFQRFRRDDIVGVQALGHMPACLVGAVPYPCAQVLLRVQGACGKQEKAQASQRRPAGEKYGHYPCIIDA